MSLKVIMSGQIVLCLCSRRIVDSGRRTHRASLLELSNASVGDALGQRRFRTGAVVVGHK